MKSSVTRLLAILLCLSLCLCGGCGESNSAAPIDDVVSFVAAAAQKTADAASYTLTVNGFGSTSENDQAFLRYAQVRFFGNQPFFEAKSGRQTESESTMQLTHEMLSVDYNPYASYYEAPLRMARHADLARYLKKDTPVTTDENGVRCVRFYMYFGSLSLLMTDELESDGITASIPVEVRYYVDKDGYLCEMQYDRAVHPDGSGAVYTSSFRYEALGTTVPDSNFQGGLTETVEQPFPQGQDNSVLTAATVRDYAGAPAYTTEDILAYEGRIAGGCNFGVDAALKADGTVLLDDPNESTAEASLWTDICYIDSCTETNGILGVTKDGRVLKAGFTTNDRYDICDLSAFTDIKAVAIGTNTFYGVKTDGSVVATGEHAAAVSGWSDVKQLDAYNDNVIALKNDGTVYVAGDYQVTDAASWTGIKQVAAGRFHVVGLKTDGTVVTAGVNPLENSYGEQDVGDWTDVVGIAAGNMATYGLKSDGTVLARGYKCEYVNSWPEVVCLFVDGNSRFGLRADGRIYGASEWDLF